MLGVLPKYEKAISCFWFKLSGLESLLLESKQLDIVGAILHLVHEHIERLLY